MAVVREHVSAMARFTDSADRIVCSFQKVRPNISAANMNSIREGVAILRGAAVKTATLTVTEELKDA